MRCQTVVDHLREARITGWRGGALRVNAVKHLAGQDFSYSELVVIGRTRGYPEKVGLVIDKECKVCGRRIYFPPLDGLVMPQECWDGMDIFMVEGVGVQVATEAFRQVIEQHQHTGVTFVPIADWRPMETDMVYRGVGAQGAAYAPAGGLASIPVSGDATITRARR